MRSIRIQVRKGKVEFQGSPPHSLRAGKLRLHILLKPMTDTIPVASRGYSHLFGDSAARAAGICGVKPRNSDGVPAFCSGRERQSSCVDF